MALLIDQDFVPGYFFEASTRAFNASAPFDEPTLDSIRVLILHCWFTMCFRGTHVGTAVLAMALSQMQALELDFEPPPSMPRKQAMDRLNLFVSLASLDWSSCISFKRSYSLQEEPVKMPYLFGERTLSFKDYDEERELVTLHRRVSTFPLFRYFRSLTYIRPIADRAGNGQAQSSDCFEGCHDRGGCLGRDCTHPSRSGPPLHVAAIHRIRE